MAHALNWFEIPVTDIERAMKFYSTVMAVELHKMTMDYTTMAMFPAEKGEVSGAIVSGQGYEPSMTGTLVYLKGGDDLAVPLARVEAAGGKILVPKTDIGSGFGFFAIFTDTEGNKVGLHSAA